MPLKLVLGLGNPGAEYQATRHNAGFWLLDQLAARAAAQFSAKRKFCAEVAAAPPLYLFKPQTFMNLSGETALAALQFYRAAPDELLVVHDEVDLPPGTVKLKQGGGDAGHRGLADISRRLGSGYWRLRLGIGKPAAGGVHDYVLRQPSPGELQQIQTAIARTLALWDDVLTGDYNKVMQALHSGGKEAEQWD